MTDLDDDIDFDSGGALTPKVTSRIFEYYLVGYIKSPENYIKWFDAIRHAGQYDTVKIYINSCGGDMFTAIQFMRVLAETEARVVCSVEGACMSAATMIFLCADSFEITPHSMFMFHNYSGGSIGKGGELFDQIKHERMWSEQLLREIYAGFLSDTEIQSLLDNKDLWMDVDEVAIRMEDRYKRIAEEEQEIVDVKQATP